MIHEGKLIDAYLASGKDLDDRAVHLLFSANRWECAKDIMAKLNAGTTIISDRCKGSTFEEN